MAAGWSLWSLAGTPPEKWSGISPSKSEDDRFTIASLDGSLFRFKPNSWGAMVAKWYHPPFPWLHIIESTGLDTSTHKFSINPTHEWFQCESIRKSHPPWVEISAGSPASSRMVEKRAGEQLCLISLRRRWLRNGGGAKVVLVTIFFWHDKKTWFWQFFSSKTKESCSWFKRNYIRWTRYIVLPCCSNNVRILERVTWTHWGCILGLPQTRKKRPLMAAHFRTGGETNARMQGTI